MAEAGSPPCERVVSCLDIMRWVKKGKSGPDTGKGWKGRPDRHQNDRQEGLTCA